MTPIERALSSLDGLSAGDAFGEQFFYVAPDTIPSRRLPAGPWRWTDDTHMALSIVEILGNYGHINQNALARAFARRYADDPHRGYAGGAARLLGKVYAGDDWRAIAPTLFGSGSYGNGGAMRAAPIGAFFSDDPERAAREAKLSAQVTHAHPEGQAGASAVAAAAAVAASAGELTAETFIRETVRLTPDGKTRQLMEVSMDLGGRPAREAAAILGSGEQVSAQDTVPFSLWCAAHYLNDYQEALWNTVSGLGDRDTTCAIVGGIVVMRAPIPEEWLTRREPLPSVV